LSAAAGDDRNLAKCPEIDNGARQIGD